MTKLEHAVFCRKCRVYMELGAFNWEAGHFDGPYLHMTTQRTDSDYALRCFLENHRRHNIGFASEQEIDELHHERFKEIQPTDVFCASFVSDMKEIAYRFEDFSRRFQKVLFIVDIYNWAWDIASRELLTYLPEVDGTVVDLADFRTMDFNHEEWDMVLVYPWIHKDIMIRLDPGNTVVCVAGGEQLEEHSREFNLNCGRFIVYGACNNSIQKALRKRYPRKRVFLLSHGVDTEKFKPNPIPHDEFTVGWVGAVNRKIKRFWLAEKICDDIGVKLKVVGRGGNTTHIPHDEMPKFYNSIDTLFITSTHEAHPLCAYEAMSCSIPIVASNVGDLWEIIENGVNGFIFDPCRQKRSFPEALKMLREDEELRKSMGEICRNEVLKKWKWEFIANQYRALGNAPSVREEPPRVSVITVVKNRVKTIKRCLDSVLSEEYPNLEFIIVDGASDDGTLEILREYEQKHRCIKLISEPDRSQGEARNKGLRAATGDYVTFQDSDDEMISGKLGILSEFLANNDKYFAVFGNTVFRRPTGEIYTDNRRSIPQEVSFKTLSKNNYIGSGSIMLRNTPEIRFDPDKIFGEDYDLWMKVAMKYPIAHLDFDAYLWTSMSPDGIGANIPWKQAVEIDVENKRNAMKTYSGSPHSADIRVAVFCDAFGLHPYGGPAIYGYNIAEMLYRSRLFYTMYYGPDPMNAPHPNYFRREEVLRPRPKDIDPSDFNIFYVMNSPQAIVQLNRMGIQPIIGSNHITNSAADHCVKYLTEEQLIHRGHLIEHEKAFPKSHVGKFWFAQSKFQIGEYKRVGMDLEETRVYLAPNPTDTELFKRRTDFGDAIIWSGKNNWAKGIPFLKRVAKSIQANFMCLWGGEGKDFPTLSRNCVVVRGSTLFDIPRYLNKGQIFLSTSVTENQPCAALEAMAMELPVVGFKTSGMPEVVEDGETGFLVELDDTKGMVDKIEVLLNDESLRREMGKKARDFVVNNFSYHSAMDVYLEHFKSYLES